MVHVRDYALRPCNHCCSSRAQAVLPALWAEEGWMVAMVVLVVAALAFCDPSLRSFKESARFMLGQGSFAHFKGGGQLFSEKAIGSPDPAYNARFAFCDRFVADTCKDRTKKTGPVHRVSFSREIPRRDLLYGTREGPILSEMAEETLTEDPSTQESHHENGRFFFFYYGSNHQDQAL